MDLMEKLLNLVVPPVSILTLAFVLPPFMFFKFFIWLKDSVFPENVVGKVILITGASSGIGEHIAYEYAKRGAFLAISGRRKNRLRQVAEAALQFGAADVIIILADITVIDDCKRLVDQTMHHFDRLDHLVNCAGITSIHMFQEVDDVTDFRPIMDTNFWGSVYVTRFAIPHLRNSNGSIVAVSSLSSWWLDARMSVYNASKAAVSQFFETIRVELGSDIKITLVTPAPTESEITQGKSLHGSGRLEFDPDKRDVQVSGFPVVSVETCAAKIVKSACKGKKYVTIPEWMSMIQLWRFCYSEVLEWILRLIFITKPGSPPEEALSKKILDISGAKRLVYPQSIQEDIDTPE